MNAPCIEQIRNEGHHQNLIKSIDKNNEFNDLLMKRYLMETSARNDKLQKDLIIYPDFANFGSLKMGTWYETKIMVKNEDSLLQRIKISSPNNPNIKIYQKNQGPIASGMSREILVKFNVDHTAEANVYETFEITSKYKVYNIPIYANVIDALPQNSITSKLPKPKPEDKKGGATMRFPVREIKTMEGDATKHGISKVSETGELTGTLTAEYLPKISYDKNVNINTQQRKQEKIPHDLTNSGNF